jgi:hypothetical protein
MGASRTAVLDPDPTDRKQIAIEQDVAVNQHVEGNLKSVFARRGELLLVMISR